MVAGFGGGIGTLFRGFGLWGSSPGLMLLGALPALLVAVVVTGLLVLLVVELPALTSVLTPFANDWAAFGRDALRVAIGIALLVLAIVLAVSTFTALALAVGDPFYERIHRAVEERLGGFDAPDEPGFWASLARGIGSGARLVALSALLGLAAFLIGLVPLVGTVLAFALGALGGGWLLAVELLGRPFEARGLDSGEQAELRRRSRARVLGFGLACYLVFLIPFAAIVAMPAAVAGSTLLARRLLTL